MSGFRELIMHIQEADIFRAATKRDLVNRQKSIPHEMRVQAVDEYSDLVQEFHDRLEEADGTHTAIVNFNLGYALPLKFKNLFDSRINKAAEKVSDVMYELEDLINEMNNWVSDNMNEEE